MSGHTGAFNLCAPARKGEGLRKTVIEDTPQVSVRRAAPPGRLQPRSNFKSPLSESFPTPRAIPEAHAMTAHSSPSMSTSDSESDHGSGWSQPGSKGDFDELYDVSESEDSEDIPIKLSSSVKRRMERRASKSRYPSIVIPSPGQWPSIDKLKTTSALSPPLQMTLSPSILSQLKERRLKIPSSSATPSLDGSFTSEELAVSSCPSTPDIEHVAQDQTAWEPPIQLDPLAMNVLSHISSDEQHEALETVIEIPEEAVSEMREIVESPPFDGRFRLETKNLPRADEADDELSALSVPSPGGFFASLDSSVARGTWNNNGRAPDTSTATDFYGLPFRRSSTPPPLPTSTATSFYDLPWKQRPENPVEHVVTVDTSGSEHEPVTARKVVFSPTETVKEIDEIDESYGEKLEENASAHMDRTKLWLHAQNAYMRAICEDDRDDLDSLKDVQDVVPKTPEMTSSAETSSPLSGSSLSPSKKSVRFVADVLVKSDGSTVVEKKRISPIHDGTFWQGWRYHKRSQRARDVFQHSQARAEAEQVRRISLPKQHVDQLQGKYEIVEASRPEAHRPISSLVPAAPEDEKSEVIAQATRERQALQQIQSSSWHIAAQREVNGGKLLTSPTIQTFKGRNDVNILDLAGQPNCGWAWSVALKHPQADVYTTVPTDAEAHVAEISLDGPANHFVVASPKLWELPFEDKFFDVVSARNLYAHLKTTWPKGHAVDEWDLTLRECLRILKPGGYLEYDLLDAELVHPETTSQALGVEFAFNLKTRGYDPAAGKSFLPRLKRAGFRDIKRAWMLYPVGDVAARWTDSPKPGNPALNATRTIGSGNAVSIFEAPVTGSTQDVRAMTGLVGARLWEQWMIKLSTEMGRNERQCLYEVAQALEEGGHSTSAWRCLTGWARKDV